MSSRPTDQRPPGRLRARLAAMPHEAAVMAALCLVGASGCLLGILFPVSEHTPIGTGWALIAVGTTVAALDLGLGARLPRWALHAQLILISACAALLVGRSHTGAGAMTTAIAFPWFGVYAAVYFPRRAALAHATLLTVLLGAGVVASPAPITITAWAIVAVSLWTAVLALSTFTQRLHDLASTDPLTGVLNRAGLFAAARREMARAARTGEPLSLVAIDLDDLKTLNDGQGHAAGDRLLAAASAAWGGALRASDVVARTGGDEFIVLAPNTTSAHARALVERLRRSHPARWSAGTAEWRRGEPFDAWLERADGALYRDKARRRLRDTPTAAANVAA